MKNNISITKEELEQYPLLSKIEEGLRVVAKKGTDYKGLEGEITEIRYGNQKETDNDCILEIIVDFEEPEFVSLDEAYPHLNGTSIGQVIMCEESLGFYFDGNPIAQDATGKIICPDCLEALNYVSEVQEDEIFWNLNEKGEWIKENGIGGSNGKRCPYCDARIMDEETILSY